MINLDQLKLTNQRPLKAKTKIGLKRMLINRDKYEILFENHLKMLAPKLSYEREFKFHSVRKWRFDFSFDYKVAVEIDGGQWAAGGGRHNTDSDRDKINTAVSMGWSILRFSPTQITNDPMACVSLLITTLDLKRK